MNTGNEGARRPHIVDVVPGHLIRIRAVETRLLGDRDYREDDSSPWLYLPAGRGE